MRKQFVTPRVIQEVQIQLEKDLLEGGSIRPDTVLTSEGQGVGNYGVSNDPADPDASYFAEW